MLITSGQNTGAQGQLTETGKRRLNAQGQLVHALLARQNATALRIRGQEALRILHR